MPLRTDKTYRNLQVRLTTGEGSLHDWIDFVRGSTKFAPWIVRVLDVLHDAHKKGLPSVTIELPAPGATMPLVHGTHR